MLLNDNPSKSSPFIMIRLSVEEAENFRLIKEKYRISARTIFEVVWNTNCQGDVIAGLVKRAKHRKGGGLKEVKIPRNIFQCKKVSK